MVLAGGEGKRLLPLTLDRAKPAVPFGGHYRLIDFPLSNLANGGYRKIVILTQYKSHSMDVHLARTWRMNSLLGNFVAPVPAQMRAGKRWFLGSADAIYQNLNIIHDEGPDYVFVFGADHIYRFDPSQMLDHHIATGAGVTVAAIRVDRNTADQFGVITPGPGDRIASFVEKPAVADTTGLDDAPGEVLASMGNYVFSSDYLEELVRADEANDDSLHDVGGNLIPAAVADGKAGVYDFRLNNIPGQQGDRHYWRDVGSLDSYFEAHQDLISEWPAFDLYNRRWPILTASRSLPPAKVVYGGGHTPEIAGSLLSKGVIVSGARVHRSVLSQGARVEPGAVVEDSVLLDDVVVEQGAVVRRAVLDKNVSVPAGVQIGTDPAFDAEHYTVSPGGIVVLAKGQAVVRPS
jgi:glucose-1-phosphate adenylyltransferase